MKDKNKIESSLEKFCDHFCKWPLYYSSHYEIPEVAQSLLDDKCKHCPLAEVLK